MALRMNRCKKLPNPTHSQNTFLWVIDLMNISLTEAIEAQTILDQDQIKRSQKFVTLEDRHRFLICHAIVKIKLAQLLHKKVSQISFTKNQYGKPYLKQNELYFNISHTKKKAVLAVNFSYEVGVDIEDASCQYFENEIILDRNYSSVIGVLKRLI